MSFLDRFRRAERQPDGRPGGEASESAAPRLIAEGNAFEDQGALQDALARYDAAIRAAPNSPRAHLSRGNALLALGDAQGASAAYSQALVRDPNYAPAHYNLGNALLRLHQQEDAIASYRHALTLKPDFADAEVALGALYEDLGQPEAAAASYRRALKIQPGYAAVHANLGNVLQSLGQFEGAIASYRRALEFDPEMLMAHFGLANALQAVGQHEDAVANFRRAIHINPDFAPAHGNLGNALQSLGRNEEAIASYRRVLQSAPALARAHFDLGNLLKQEGRLDEAKLCFKRLLEIEPENALAHQSMGSILLEQRNSEGALRFYRKALELKPELPEALCNLGLILKGKHRQDEAITCFQKALDFKPDLPEAHFHLGNVYLDQDRVRAAMECYREALRLRPDYVDARWSILACHLPAVYETADEPGVQRAAFSQDLEKLDHWLGADRTTGSFNSVRIQTPFYLAYQEQNNRDLLRRHGVLCARIMAEWLQRQPFSLPAQRCDEDAVRVGIVSHHIRDHSVWHAIVKGWLQRIDPKRFALHVFQLGEDEDQETEVAKRHAAYFEQGEKSLQHWAEVIADNRLDVLLYPEIGMEGMAGRLACLRLAPVQVATWGHPETSGIPTIDYYLSAAGLEPDNAQEHYSERLVTLPNLGCFCEPHEITVVRPDLAKLKIDSASPLLLCPGVPYKYAPQHDWVLAEIARRLGRCQFIFFVFPPAPNMSKKLRQRLEMEFRRKRLNLDDCAVFIPWQEGANFFGLLERADVFLDTIGFSGFNTALKALECGLPIVTREGRFLRGRLASGILKRIGLEELVAQSEEGYIEQVVKLVQDAEYHKRTRNHIEASRHRLFEDETPIRALEGFLVKAKQEAKSVGGRDGLV